MRELLIFQSGKLPQVLGLGRRAFHTRFSGAGHW